MHVAIIPAQINPTKSLDVKYGWNLILSLVLAIPKGLFDASWC